MNPYETRRVVADYLAFHYPAETSAPIPREAQDFALRVVDELADPASPVTRALDIGCAVGRTAFELARRAPEVVGIDFSQAFIAAANTLRDEGEIATRIPVEGERTEPFTARVPAGIDRSRVVFEVGDATALRPDLGSFDLVVAANLLCRLPDCRPFLQRLSDLVRPGGQLLLATPFSWLPEYTARENWLGGREGDAPSWDLLCKALEPDFSLELSTDLPFLIREHARKYQYGISLGSRWRRR